jgi:sigma-B regulation protein RsbU (phosphoserine phosphatase)
VAAVPQPHEIQELSLEIPENIESPDALKEIMFQEDLPLLASKLSILEAFFNLPTKNISFQDFMRELLLIIMKVIRSEAASLLEVDYVNKNIFFRAAAGVSSDQIVKYVIPLGRGIVGHVVESKQPYLLADAKENKVHLQAISNAVGFSTRNMLAFPLIIQGKVFGVIELLNRIAEKNFTETDFEILSYLSPFIAKTIEIRLMLTWAKASQSTLQATPRDSQPPPSPPREESP